MDFLCSGHPASANWWQKMAKLKRAPDFHLDCNCFLQVQKGACAQGCDIPGLQMYSSKNGESGLCLILLKRLIDPNGTQQQGMIQLNFCPFCGKKISIWGGKGGNIEDNRI